MNLAGPVELLGSEDVAGRISVLGPQGPRQRFLPRAK